MENATLVAKGLAGLAHALLAGAEASEVLGSLGADIGAELERRGLENGGAGKYGHFNSTSGLATNSDIEENDRETHCSK